MSEFVSLGDDLCKPWVAFQALFGSGFQSRLRGGVLAHVAETSSFIQKLSTSERFATDHVEGPISLRWPDVVLADAIKDASVEWSSGGMVARKFSSITVDLWCRL